MNKPLSKRSATLLGAGLWTFGAALILFTASQLDGAQGPIIIVAAGLISCGSWVSTVAKAMKDPGGEEPNESQTKT